MLDHVVSCRSNFGAVHVPRCAIANIHAMLLERREASLRDHEVNLLFGEGITDDAPPFELALNHRITHSEPSDIVALLVGTRSCERQRDCAGLLQNSTFHVAVRAPVRD
jgi:hypothetical protein